MIASANRLNDYPVRIVERRESEPEPTDKPPTLDLLLIALTLAMFAWMVWGMN